MSTETTKKTDATPAKVVAIVEPQSELLTKLKSDKKAAWAEMRKFEDPDAPEAVEAKLAVYKIDQDIKAEIASLRKIEADAKIAEQRNARVALVDNYDAAVLALTNAKKDDKPAAQDEVNTAREVIVNELLARYATSKPATGGTATTSGTKGATSKAIVELYIANKAGGMNDTENKKAIEAAGYSRGTTGAAVLAYQKEIGEK